MDDLQNIVEEATILGAVCRVSEAERINVNDIDFEQRSVSMISADRDVFDWGMVTELINHIDVYHAEKVSSQIPQKITIHYNCICTFEVPDRESIPELEVYIKTRKGVALSYANKKRSNKNGVSL